MKASLSKFFSIFHCVPPKCFCKCKNTLNKTNYNSVEGYRSNQVLAVKRSLFVEIRFSPTRLMSIFFEPLQDTCTGFLIATLDRPMACQMAKLKQIKA